MIKKNGQHIPRPRPTDLSRPIDIQVFFYNQFHLCVCMEEEPIIQLVHKLLKWISMSGDDRPSYDTLYEGNVPVFYLLIGMLDDAGLCEHGVSIRHPFLTSLGEDLLAGLNANNPEIIMAAEGEAYDGLFYGEGV